VAQALSPNPVLTNGFRDAPWATDEKVMTVEGAVNKTILMAMVLTAAAVVGWLLGDVGLALALPAILIGFVLAMISYRKPEKAAVLAMPYAIVEGLVVGAISHAYNAGSLNDSGQTFGGGGIVLTAVGLTIGVLVAMLTLYRTGLIRVTQKFRATVMMMTVGVMLFYGVTILVNLFGGNMPVIDNNGGLGILFSVFVVGLASVHLLLNFDFIEQSAARRLPEYYEWVAAIGLIANLVWLYLELLRLLARLQRR
jgi:uncharacterized YccA/Bax inhibitor family protein